MTTPSTAPALVDAIDRLVRVSFGLTTVALENHGSGPDLTLHQWRALVFTAEAGDGGVRVGAIARSLGIAVPGASRLVGRLEGRGLVRAQRDPHDRRATIVRATPPGAALWAKVVRRRRRHIEEAVTAAGIGPGDPAEVVLDRLVRGLAPFA